MKSRAEIHLDIRRHALERNCQPVCIFFLIDILDFKAGRDRIPRVKSQINNLDLASAARLGLVLERVVDRGSVGVSINRAKYFDGFIMLGELVYKIACRPRGKSLWMKSRNNHDAHASRLLSRPP
jgi:hypothetical protein